MVFGMLLRSRASSSGFPKLTGAGPPPALSPSGIRMRITSGERIEKTAESCVAESM
jgi:hypothetical protein